MDIPLVILSALYCVVLLLIYSVERVLVPKDVFSAGRVFVYFKSVSAFTLLWFAFNQHSIESMIFAQVNPEFRDFSLVRAAYYFSIFSLVIVYLGILAGSKSKMSNLGVLLNTLFSERYFGGGRENNKKCYILGGFTFGAGVLVYFLFLSKMGGLSAIWYDLSARVEMMSGLGYYYKVYSFLMFLGSTLIFASAGARRRWVVAAVPAAITVFAFGSMGQRGPVIAYLFALFVIYHYKIKPIDNLLTVKNITLGLCVLMFIVGAVQFRGEGAISRYASSPGQLVSDSARTFEHHVIQRFGRIERDIVILKYFDENRFWLGSSYYSLLVAPVPRTIYPDKPPIDTGRYLLAMAQGENITPPVPTSQLPSSSFPDGNWAGYMNFYIPGFVALFFLSGLCLGLVYKYTKRTNYSAIPVVMYSHFAWSGDIDLSPMGVVNILMFLLPLVVLTFFVRFILYTSRPESDFRRQKRHC